MTTQFEAVVIGAGTTGAAAIYHLAEAGMRNMLCLEAGAAGRGVAVAMAVANSGVPPDHVDTETSYLPHISGSAVFHGGDAGPSTIKMVVTVPPYKNLEEFAEHHGWGGVEAYLEAAACGRNLIKEMGRKVLPRPDEQIKCLGSMMVCEDKDVAELKTEFEHLQRLGCECFWLSKEQVQAVHGTAAGFAAGISFPHDAILDSPSYAQALLNAAIRRGAVQVRERCSVTDIETLETGSVKVHLADGETIITKKVIVATGGFYIDKHLAGILTPCFSYLVAVPCTSAEDSPNFFTYGFSHDWCMAATTSRGGEGTRRGYIRVSGEDHYSALKRPRWQQRCGRLAEWARRKYPHRVVPNALPQGETAPALAVVLDGPAAECPALYGVYSETPDMMPVVGFPAAAPGVCYIVGCNAWGQASLSAAAALAPALLGLRDMTRSERRTADLFSIRRFTGVPASHRRPAPAPSLGSLAPARARL